MHWFFSKLLGAFLIAISITIIFPLFFPKIYQMLQGEHSLYLLWIISFILLAIASAIVYLILWIHGFLIKRGAGGVIIG